MVCTYEEYLKQTNCVSEHEWFDKVKEYEANVMRKRGN